MPGPVGEQPVQATYDVRVGAVAIITERLDVDEIHVRCDAQGIAIIRNAGACDDTCHVSPMTMFIDSEKLLVGNRIVISGDPVRAVDVTPDVPVIRPAAGVEDGHCHSETVDALGVEDVSSNELDVLGVRYWFAVCSHLRVIEHVDAGLASYLVQLALCQLHGDGPDDGQSMRDDSADRNCRCRCLFHRSRLDDETRHSLFGSQPSGNSSLQGRA